MFLAKFTKVLDILAKLIGVDHFLFCLIKTFLGNFAQNWPNLRRLWYGLGNPIKILGWRLLERLLTVLEPHLKKQKHGKFLTTAIIRPNLDKTQNIQIYVFSELMPIFREPPITVANYLQYF